MQSSTTASGKVEKTVTCEACHHVYTYTMSRMAFGKCSDSQKSASEAAEIAAKEAAKLLQEKLDNECDLCACPKCGAFTTEMVKHGKTMFRDLLAGEAVLALILGGFYLCGKFTGHWFVVWGSVAAVLFVAGAVLLLVQTRLIIRAKVKQLFSF